MVVVFCFNCFFTIENEWLNQKNTTKTYSKRLKDYLKKHYKEVYNRQQIAYNDESHILYMQKNTTAKYAILSFQKTA